MPDFPDRRQREAELAVIIATLFDDQYRTILSGGGQISWSNAEIQTAARIAGPLGETALAAARFLAEKQGFADLPAGAETELRRWAAGYSSVFSAELTDSTRRKVIAAAKAARNAEDLAARLAAIFSADRANDIAVTETTRAISGGERILIAYFIMRTGQSLNPVWKTEADGLVCPVCAPLHNQPETVFSVAFPAGPPAHPRCRCHLEYFTDA
ncbi:MAG TPA: hypothetical protein VMY42_13945 [Thermoguttaceae bacterium]|nr:hypothetical protein [Thermoguttaceae bacterium]